MAWEGGVRAGGAGGALVDPPLLAVAEEVVAEPSNVFMEELDALHLVERRATRRSRRGGTRRPQNAPCRRAAA